MIYVYKCKHMAKEIPGTHFVGQVSLKAIIARDETVLVVRDLIDSKTWDLPGGRVHKEEKIEEGLAREVFEETGIEITVGNPIFTERFIRERDNIPTVLIAYVCTPKSETISLSLAPDEIAEAKWVSADEVETLMVYSSCKKALQTYFHRH